MNKRNVQLRTFLLLLSPKLLFIKEEILVNKAYFMIDI